MGKIRFAIIGAGWRARYYIRIAKAMPDRFEITGVLFRNEEKMHAFEMEYQIPATLSKEEILEEKPDFVVVSVSKGSICDVTREYSRAGIPVLCETPAALTLENLINLWKDRLEHNTKVQTAEQYFLYPSYSKVIKACESGKLGNVEFLTISCAHDYHAASLIRRILGVQNERVTISGKKHNFQVTETDSRQGIITDGRVSAKEHSHLTLEFEKGKFAFYDFCGVRYRSYICGKYLQVQGRRGEIINTDMVYLDDENVACAQSLAAEKGILPEDETAVFKCLLGMKEYIETGKEFYPLDEALEDAYWSILMHEAENTERTVTSSSQIWSGKLK